MPVVAGPTNAHVLGTRNLTINKDTAQTLGYIFFGLLVFFAIGFGCLLILWVFLQLGLWIVRRNKIIEIVDKENLHARPSGNSTPDKDRQVVHPTGEPHTPQVTPGYTPQPVHSQTATQQSTMPSMVPNHVYPGTPFHHITFQSRLSRSVGLGPIQAYPTLPTSERGTINISPIIPRSTSPFKPHPAHRSSGRNLIGGENASYFEDEGAWENASYFEDEGAWMKRKDSVLVPVPDSPTLPDSSKVVGRKDGLHWERFKSVPL